MSVQGILGKKVGMTQVFDEQGRVVPVTVLSVPPCVVTQVKTVDRDGYSAVQLGFEDIKETRLTRPEQGHLAAAGVRPKRHLREFGIQEGQSVTVGQEIKADVFAVGDKVQISGTSKGKGFAGVVKRYHWHGADMTHGSMIHRKPQSAGATDAARIFKNTGRPGRMGNERVTVKRLEVVRVDADRNVLLIRGAVPGPKGGLVLVKTAAKGGAP